jgi:hypothetical protein
MDHAGRHDNRFAFGDFATGRWQSKSRSTGKQPHDFVAGMEMRPETPGELTTVDDFQRPSAGLARARRSMVRRKPSRAMRAPAASATKIHVVAR